PARVRESRGGGGGVHRVVAGERPGRVRRFQQARAWLTYHPGAHGRMTFATSPPRSARPASSSRRAPRAAQGCDCLTDVPVVTPVIALIIFAAGAGAGLLGALLGIGGGVLLVPFLNLALGLPISVAA